MDTSFSRLRYLFRRYQSGEATAAERREFMDIVRAGAHEKALQQLIGEEIESDGQPELTNTPPLSEEGAERIFSRIVRSVPLPAEKPPVRRIPAWIGWTAAAAFILAALVNLPYLKPRKHAPAIAAGPLEKYDAAPGKRAAVLTLASGQQIALDSAASDTVGRQGNMAVINLKGILAYNATTASGNTGEPAYNTLTTNVGNQYQLVLPDGSRIWLNAASSVRFPVNFSNRERNVEITGEAYFEIAPDTRRPFLVHYKDMTVQVLGTHFNVNAYADEQAVATTLLEGSVKVIRGRDHTLITPGQQVQLCSKGMYVWDNVNTEEIVAWKEDQFYFRRADIQGIMRQLSRWYNIKVDYEGQNIEERFYAKIPRSVPLSEALKALSLTGKVHFRTGDKTVTVYP
ncbi:MAG: FecR family protein [Chitinophagaceae bacterium]|nr:FecR family protein [Chitinophagaceae bacterium]